jgi:hypothetical protein
LELIAATTFFKRLGLDICVDTHLDQIGAGLIENEAEFPSLFRRAFKQSSDQREELPHQIRRKLRRSPVNIRDNGNPHGVEFSGQFADLFCVEERRLFAQFADPLVNGVGQVFVFLCGQFKLQATPYARIRQRHLGQQCRQAF